MPSDLQKEASRRNGAKSRGPVTAEGKRKSASNGLRHGMFANSIVLPYESRGRFVEMLSQMIFELKPRNQVEMMLVETMAAAQWRKMRIWLIEHQSLTLDAGRQKQESGAEPTAPNVPPPVLNVPSPAFAEHEARLDRQFNVALGVLKELKKLNPNSKNA